MIERDYITCKQASEQACLINKSKSERAIRHACLHSLIPGTIKFGGRWLIPRTGLIMYLTNPPAPGRKSKNKKYNPKKEV